MPERHLRPADPDEKAPQPEPKSVADAVAGDSNRAVFVALQKRIADAIDDPNIRGADLAALSRRLHELRKEVEAIDALSEQEGGADGEPQGDKPFDATAI